MAAHVNETERERVAVERFMAEIKHSLHSLVRRSGTKQNDIAKRLGITPALVCRMLSPKYPMTLRSVGRVLYAIGMLDGKDATSIIVKLGGKR